ncbi:MAG: hypothetical protein ACTS4V_01625 [Candidatus Hodgkinia cicadicola]
MTGGGPEQLLPRSLSLNRPMVVDCLTKAGMQLSIGLCYLFLSFQNVKTKFPILNWETYAFGLANAPKAYFRNEMLLRLRS